MKMLWASDSVGARSLACNLGSPQGQRQLTFRQRSWWCWGDLLSV